MWPRLKFAGIQPKKSQNVNQPPVIPLDGWKARAAEHRQRILSVAGPYLSERRTSTGHPVYDFLFTYYSFRPKHLLAWTPGIGTVLDDPHAEFPMRDEFSRVGTHVALDPDRFPARRTPSLNWIRDLLKGMQHRTPVFGCFGLHEWAMVYREPHVRHAHPLRIARDQIDALVESGPLRCSHYDAFRFFTRDARPLNRLQPTSESRVNLEQRGCLHANMDLYRWCTKLWPWVSSELMAEAFLLAWSAREIDMRASPYDLSALGFDPIPLELEIGRREYESLQRDIASVADPIRSRLINEIDSLNAAIGQHSEEVTEQLVAPAIP